MLDNETKRKIDSARSILVGKVPDPKAQVEQITTALIYKFMDDMDREAEELGGHAKFITGEIEAYRWAKLMSKELSGAERHNLYMSALLDFAKSADIPPIFRTIFKDAFLPYKDPETLSLFLKEIDYFDYDHSENLGNAFEYLLSILGSQGDAGQFRTPRHIIDFIVEILEPKKNESVLDPACGTAGFLISAYKHIMANNTLTPDEKKALMQNFTGYDISPDMVRLSLVNMYLHSFPTPKIYEYDTLTSEERWNDSFDVILANPPFMTPKGGIRPHNRFSVQANRSEVLFVDYIAEHLNLNGRSGIIVPEGIIFQSANAYKALRKMLVENNFLWAVVSLPAGVFQPYSGVKTSILLLDRSIAKHREEILFVKVSNDGFDLGAQRRGITKNDLPEALELLKAYRLGKAFESALAHSVAKAKIAESGDYNLTGDRYKESTRVVQTAYPMVKLGDVCEVISGQSPESEYYNSNGDGLPFYQGKTEFTDFFIGLPKIWTRKITKISEKNDILMSVRAPVGPVNISTQQICIGRGLAAIRTKEKTNFMYIFHLLKNMQNELKGNGGAVFDSINREQISNLEIPLPPIEIQNEIVAQIEEWQKIIDGAKQVINTYRPTITIDPSWEIVKLGDVCETRSGGTPSTSEQRYYEPKEVAWLKSEVCKDVFVNIPTTFISKIGLENSSAKIFPANIPVVALVGATIGKTAFVTFEFSTNQNIAACIPKNHEQINTQYLFYALQSKYHEFVGDGNKFKMANLGFIRELKIPLPPLEIQNKIVEQIEKERQAVESCKTLVEIFEAKIKAKIDEVWGNVENE